MLYSLASSINELRDAAARRVARVLALERFASDHLAEAGEAVAIAERERAAVGELRVDLEAENGEEKALRQQLHDTEEWQLAATAVTHSPDSGHANCRLYG